MARQGDAGGNTGGTGTGTSSTMSGSASSFSGSSSRSSSSNYNDAGEYVGVGSLAYADPYGLRLGLNTEHVTGVTAPPAETDFGIKPTNPPDISLGVQNTSATRFRDEVQDSWLGRIAKELPVIGPILGQVGSYAEGILAIKDKLGPREMAKFRSATGFGDAEFAEAEEAVATGRTQDFDNAFNERVGGSSSSSGTRVQYDAHGYPTTPEAGPAKAAGPMDDIFSQFAGGPTGFTMPTMPEFEADPSGMIAGGKGYMDDYNATYKPYAKKMMAEVDRYGSQDYIAQQRGMAMADVQQQYDNSMGQNTREMARMGVNPASGRMAAMRNQGAIQSAAAKVNAAAKAEGMAKTAYMSGLGAVNSMGMDTAKMGQGWAAMGNDAAKTKMAYNMGAAEFGMKGQIASMDNARGWGQIAATNRATDKGITVAQMNSDAKSKSDNMGVYGLIAQSVLKPSKSNWWNQDEDEE